MGEKLPRILPKVATTTSLMLMLMLILISVSHLRGRRYFNDVSEKKEEITEEDRKV